MIMSETQQAITALDTLVKQNGALIEENAQSKVALQQTYAYLKTKGAIMPEDKNFANLPATVAQIVDAHTQAPLSAMTVPNSATYTDIDLSNINYIGTLFNLNGWTYMESFKAPYSTTLTNIVGMCRNCSRVKYADLSRLADAPLTNISNLFWSASALLEIDLSMLNTAAVTTFSRVFTSCSSLKKANLRGLNFNNAGNYGFEEFFYNCGNLEWVNLLGTVATGVTRNTYNGTQPGPTYPNCPTFVGDATYEEVKNGNLKIMEGLGTSIEANYTIVVGGLDTNKASRLAMINGVADVSSSSYTLALQMKTSDMSAEDLAIATNKGWSITSLG